MYDYGEDKVLCMIIDDDNIMIKMPMTWNLNHHTVVSKTTIVRSCVPPWSVLYWFISVPDDPHQFVAILKFFLPVFKFALNLSVVISNPHLKR